MRVAIMQPYLCPYLGYWQLMASADVFVVYDNLQYTKRGWLTRNRMLLNGEPSMFSLPVAHGPEKAYIRERSIAETFDRAALLRRFEGVYRRAPYFAQTFPLLETIVAFPDRNLFRFLLYSIIQLRVHLGIFSPLVVSSEVPIDHSLKGQDKVLAICETLGTTEYVNAPGGIDLYDPKAFAEHGIELKFIRPLPFEYPQLGASFVPWLSIIDVLMFNPVKSVREAVCTNYKLFEKELA